MWTLFRAETEPDAALARVEEAIELCAGCGPWLVEGVSRLTAASLRPHEVVDEAIETLSESA